MSRYYDIKKQYMRGRQHDFTTNTHGQVGHNQVTIQKTTNNTKLGKQDQTTEPENTLQQIENARVQSKNAQERLKRTQRSYELFLNQQADTSQYDFLETGGVPSGQLQMEKEILWQNFTKAQTEANQAKKTYDDLLEAYTTQMENAEKKSYEAMEMEDLNALKENQKTVVEQNQDAAIKAQNEYGLYMNQWTNADDIDFLEGNWGVTEEEKAEQKALLQGAYTATDQLTDSRESLHLMEDTYNYRYDTQLISEMSETELIALELCSNGINVTENARVINSLTPEQRAQLRKTGKYLQILTDPKGYLKYKGYGGEDLDRLAESYTRQKNAEKMEQVQQTAQNVGEKSGFWGTVSTYPAKLVGDVTSGLAAIDSGIKHTFGLSHYHGMDVNKPGYALSAYADTVRDTVSEDFTDSGKALYNRINYLADEVASDIVFGKMGKVLGVDIEKAKEVGKTVRGVMGSYGEGVRNTAMQGGTTNEALGIGTANAGIEWLTSKISVDELLKTKSLKDWDQLAKRGLKGAEQMTQEELSSIGTLVAQTAILAEDSDFYRQVEALVQTGMSEEEAKKRVYAQYCREIQYNSFLAYMNGYAEQPE